MITASRTTRDLTSRLKRRAEAIAIRRARQIESEKSAAKWRAAEAL